MTPEIMSSTSQAAPVWEPKKRDRRFSRLGECLTRMPTKTQQGDEDGDGEEVLEEADHRGRGR